MSERNLKKPSETDWARIDSMTDEEIDTSDIPPLDDEFFATAQWRMPKRQPAVTLSVDDDVPISFIKADLLNAENLPAVLREINIGCKQKEINGLLKLLNSRGIESVGALFRLATEARLEIIRNTYRGHEGRAPDNLEFVASLVVIKGIEDEAEVIEAIKTQINFLKAWEELKEYSLLP